MVMQAKCTGNAVSPRIKSQTQVAVEALSLTVLLRP